jgi:squalene-hopene/tetraprenyl-beta-curcumene cyclase
MARSSFVFTVTASASALLTASLSVGAPPASTSAEVRRSVERGLGFLAKEGVAWMQEQKCIACHHGAFLLWSHNEARRRGFAVDAAKLDSWTDQALDLYLNNEKDRREKKKGAVESSNLLLGQVDRPAAEDKKPSRWKAVADLLINSQQPNGSWKYEGQGQKRPDAEADEATSLWAALALTSVEKQDPDYPKARDRALTWLKDVRTGDSTELAVVRLLLELRFGEAARSQALAKELISRQNADGSWSWAKGWRSDAFATGQALYALSKTGLARDDPAVARGVKFLLDGQRPNGSWYAPTKKPTAKDNPIAVYWGSAWATIGLLQTLPEEPAKKGGTENPTKVPSR